MATHDLKLVQFQCGKEGTLFYYQNKRQVASNLVVRCPLCGSKRVQPTGRAFAPVDENAPVLKAWLGRCERWTMEVILVTQTRKQAMTLAGLSRTDFASRFQSTEVPESATGSGVLRKFEGVWVPIEIRKPGAWRT